MSNLTSVESNIFVAATVFPDQGEIEHKVISKPIEPKTFEIELILKVLVSVKKRLFIIGLTNALKINI